MRYRVPQMPFASFSFCFLSTEHVVWMSPVRGYQVQGHGIDLRAPSFVECSLLTVTVM